MNTTTIYAITLTIVSLGFAGLWLCLYGLRRELKDLQEKHDLLVRRVRDTRNDLASTGKLALHHSKEIKSLDKSLEEFAEIMGRFVDVTAKKFRGE